MRKIIEVCAVLGALVACSKHESDDQAKAAADKAPAPVAQAKVLPLSAPVTPVQPKMPDSKRGPSVESYDVKQPVAGVTMALGAEGATSWQLTVRNDTDDNLQILWDESSFVTGAGKSWGRLVPGTTRKLDLRKAHPPAPLAPHATLTELAIPEMTTEIDDLHLHYDMRPDLAGGRIYVAIATPAGKRSWMATVAESDVKPLGWWCFAAKSVPKRFCERDLAECQRQEKRLDGIRIRVITRHLATSPFRSVAVRRFTASSSPLVAVHT